MGQFSDNRDVQQAYDDGRADGRETTRLGRLVKTRRRPLERPDNEAEAYTHGWSDGREER